MVVGMQMLYARFLSDTASTLHLHHLLHFCSEALDGGEELGLVVCRYRELEDVTAPSVAVHIDVNVDGTASVAEEQVHLLLEVLDIVLGVALHFRQGDVHAHRSGRRVHLGLVPKELARLVHGLLSDSEVRYRISAKSAKVIFDLKPLTTMAVEPRRRALPPDAVARRRCSGGLSPPETPPIRPHHPLPPRPFVPQAMAVD